MMLNCALWQNKRIFINLLLWRQNRKRTLLYQAEPRRENHPPERHLKEIDPEERITTIEDTPEIKPIHQNHVPAGVQRRTGYCRSNNSKPFEAFASSPHRILLGELRGKEAYTFLRAVNTGHPDL